MGVFKVFTRFILCMLSMFLGIILLMNVLGFAHYTIFYYMYTNNVGYVSSDLNNFENSYFGFSSLLNAISSLPDINFAEVLGRCLSWLIGGFNGIDWDSIFNMEFSTEWWSVVLDVLKFIASIITFPIRIIVAFGYVIYTFLKAFALYFWWFCCLLGGVYNTPLPTSTSVSVSAFHCMLM